MVMLLLVRRDVLVADAEVQGEVASDPPVVLQEQALGVAVVLDETGAELHRRLLRSAEKEVREIEPGARHRRSVRERRGVVAREDEIPSCVRVGPALQSLKPHVSSRAEGVALPGPDQGVPERKPLIKPVGRSTVAHVRDGGEGQAGHAVVERIAGHAVDTGRAGHVLRVRIEVRAVRAVSIEAEARLMKDRSRGELHRDRQVEARRARRTAEGREGRGIDALRVPIGEGGAQGGRTFHLRPAPPSREPRAAAALAASLTRPPARTWRVDGAEHMIQSETELVRIIRGGGDVPEVLRRPWLVGKRNEGKQRPCGGIDAS